MEKREPGIATGVTLARSVGNALLHAFTCKKIYIKAGPEFGNLEGKIMLMKKAVYGTKTAALRFHESLSAHI